MGKKIKETKAEVLHEVLILLSTLIFDSEQDKEPEDSIDRLKALRDAVVTEWDKATPLDPEEEAERAFFNAHPELRP
jgi:hypothetical protein